VPFDRARQVRQSGGLEARVEDESFGVVERDGAVDVGLDVVVQRVPASAWSISANRWAVPKSTGSKTLSG
jgi:hypothetical protein